MLSAKEVFSSQNPKLVLSLFVTSLIIQVATGSIAPILTLYVRDLAGNVSNIAFISGMIASVPGIAALMSAPVWANWGIVSGRKNPHRGADYLGAAADPDVVRPDPAAVRYLALPARRRGRRAAAGCANPAGV
jgi:MFS family permease